MIEQVVEEKKVEEKKVEEKNEEIKIEIDPKVEDALTKYYKEKGKEEFLPDVLKILNDQKLKYISDWKDLSQQQKAKYPDGLVNDLDKIAGIKKDVRNNKIKTGNGDRIRQHTNTKEPRGRGERKEELRLELTWENCLDSNFGSILHSLYRWFGVDDRICREQIHSNFQPLYHGTSFSEGGKGLYQRLDEHEEVTLRKRVKSKGCK